MSFQAAEILICQTGTQLYLYPLCNFLILKSFGYCLGSGSVQCDLPVPISIEEQCLGTIFFCYILFLFTPHRISVVHVTHLRTRIHEEEPNTVPWSSLSGSKPDLQSMFSMDTSNRVSLGSLFCPVL